MPDPRGVGAAFLRYLDAGLSVIPLGYRSKRPAFSQLPINPETGESTFLPFTQKRATPAQIEKWVEANAYPGILAGPISANLKPYDFDDAEFCEWLLSNPSALDLLQKTWAVRTGSGKVHVYLRDDGTHPTPGQVKLGNRKLGDIRTPGQYVVAPPSLHEDTGEVYATIFGGPESVLFVEDTYATIMGLVGLIGPEAAERAEQAEAAAPHPPVGPSTILPMPDLKVRQAILRKLSHEHRLTSKIKRSIREGVIPGEGEWPLEHDRSKITSDVVAALMAVGWSLPVIELTLAAMPIGSLVYRNAARRGSHGRAWLLHTWREKTKLFESRQAAILIAKGLNFDVVAGDCAVWPTERIWTLRVKGPTTDPAGEWMEIKEPDLKTYSGWSSACLRRLGFYPLMSGAHRGQGDHHHFIDAVVATCAASRPPAEATAQGRLAGTVLAMADKDVLAQTPNDPGQWTLGWRDDEYFYLQPTILTYRLVTASKTPLADPEILKALGELGGAWVGVRYGQHQEHFAQMWRLPLHKITEPPHPNGTS